MPKHEKRSTTRSQKKRARTITGRGRSQNQKKNKQNATRRIALSFFDINILDNSGIQIHLSDYLEIIYILFLQVPKSPKTKMPPTPQKHARHEQNKKTEKRTELEFNDCGFFSVIN